MNILQVVTSDTGGGAEGSALNLFRAYRERGHGSWLVVGRKLRPDPDILLLPNEANRNPVAKLLQSLASGPDGSGIRSGAIPKMLSLASKVAEPRRDYSRLRGLEPMDFPGSKHLLSLVPDVKMDVVHLHNMHGGYFDLRVLPTISRQVPTVVDLRDMWLLTGHCAYPVGCSRWETGCGQCPDLTIYPRLHRDTTAQGWRLRNRVFRASNIYISTPSRWMMNAVGRSMLTHRLIRVIPNAIDLDLFTPVDRQQARRQLGLPSDAHIVLFTAQNEFKDYDFIVRALETTTALDGHPLLIVCLAREGHDRMLGQGTLTHRPFIHDQATLVSYYCAADVFVHAAKHEVFGKTLVESQACGTPVVGTDVGGIAETFVDGETGYLVTNADPLEMASKVQLLLGDAALRERLGARGTSHAREHFGLERQVRDFLAYYEEIGDDFRTVPAAV